jgi:sodium transport system permease protein
MLLRDRRTILFSIIIPIAVMPLILFSSRWIEESREKRRETATYSYAVSGSHADLVRALIAEAASSPKVEDEQNGADDENEGNDGETPLRLEEREVADPGASLAKGEIQFHIEALSAEEARLREEQDDADGSSLLPEPGQDFDRDHDRVVVPVIRIDFHGNRDPSRTGARKMRGLLDGARNQRRGALLRDRGFPVEPDEVAVVEEADLATGAQTSGAMLGRFVTALLMFFLFTGGTVIATDSIAGEKERGTLETLLTTAAERLEIVTAKLLAILSVAVFITLTQVVNLLVYVGLGVIPLPEGFVLEVSPAAAVVLLLLFLPLGALISSVLLMLSGRAKSYKEAQLYFFPVILLGALPALAAVLPGLDLRSAVVLVPVANTSVAVREVLTGEFDWLFLGLSWLVTAAAATWAIRATIRSLSVERLITASETDRAEHEGGPALFPRHVLRWYAVVWVILFVVAFNVESLSSLPGQILFNVVLLFGGASWLMIRRYRLVPREALALRAPRAAVWIGVLAGVPAAHVTGLGIFRLANLFLPVPEKMLESFGQEVLPAGMPLWQLVALIALLPGIFEEIAFRGVLLHGLRKRFHPATLCLVVGLIFGLFHVSLFRIAPTMYLGIILTAITLLTGSILPAIAWHGLNNLLALMLGRGGASLEDLDSWLYLLAAVLLALSFWVIYRNRTPYPGIRPWRRAAVRGAVVPAS